MKCVLHREKQSHLMLDNFQDDINKSFCLMQDLMELLQVSSCNSTFDFLDEILDDLGNTVKFFR